MRSVPPVCYRCKGSGSFVVPMRRPMNAHKVPLWRILDGIGFLVVPCGICRCEGSLEPPEALPDPDPSQWTHRVPKGVREA